MGDLKFKFFTYCMVRWYKIKQSPYFQHAILKLSYKINRLSNIFRMGSRWFVFFLNPRQDGQSSDFFNVHLVALDRSIQAVINEQKKSYAGDSYFYGYPYQGFAMLGIFGERPTEERYEQYHFDRFLNSDDTVLDLGCSCGFLDVYTVFRKGCFIEGVDINPFSVKMGGLCAEFLQVKDKVSFHSKRIQDLTADKLYDAVFSFATYWTDDKNYRVSLSVHLESLLKFLKPAGYIFFESHCVDFEKPNFLNNVRRFSEKHASIIYESTVDSGRRHFYIFKRHAKT